MDYQSIRIAVEEGDALEWKADVLALKYAQAPYGVDRAVLEGYEQKGINVFGKLPKPSGFLILDSHGVTNTRKVLFIGVNPLRQFGYSEIRQFGRKVLISLAGEAPDTTNIALTIHGPGYGLDEVEAFESEIAGIIDAVSSGDIPARLREITILERNVARAARLSEVLSQIIPDGKIPPLGTSTEKSLGERATERLRSVGYSSSSKPNIFIAMPFTEDLDDLYHYGIQGAVNAAGFLCERADLSSFTGDVMSWVKQRIKSSSLVIAELSGANPNVYLEVGYAWGCGRPTILLARDSSELKFDTKGQRCLVYTKIKDLEQSLHQELSNLRDQL